MFFSLDFRQEHSEVTVPGGGSFRGTPSRCPCHVHMPLADVQNTGCSHNLLAGVQTAPTPYQLSLDSRPPTKASGASPSTNHSLASPSTNHSLASPSTNPFVGKPLDKPIRWQHSGMTNTRPPRPKPSGVAFGNARAFTPTNGSLVTPACFRRASRLGVFSPCLVASLCTSRASGDCPSRSSAVSTFDSTFSVVSHAEFRQVESHTLHSKQA